MRKISLVLIFSILSSLMCSCSKKNEVILDKYNAEFLKVYNYGNSLDRNTELIDSSVFDELDTKLEDRNKNDIPQKIDITGSIEFNAFVDELGIEMADKYYSDNYGEDTNVPEEDIQSEIDYANELKVEMENALPKVDELKEKIASIPKLREILNYNEFVTEIYNMEEMYLALPSDSLRYKVSNREDLEYELNLLGGDLQNNFNLEEQLETKDNLNISDNPLDVLANSNVVYSEDISTNESSENLESDTDENIEESEEIVEDTEEIEESTEENVEETLLDDKAVEDKVESIKNDIIIEADAAYENATQSEIEYIFEGDFGPFEGFVTNGQYGFDEKAPESWYDIIIDDKKNREVTYDKGKLIKHIADTSTMLEYDYGKIYLDKSNLDLERGGCVIDILDGISIVVTATIHELGTYEKINDAIYWDDNSFIIRSTQQGSTFAVTLTGYIDRDGIARITSGLDSLINNNSYNVHIVY